MVQSHSETALMNTSNFLQGGHILGDMRIWHLLDGAPKQSVGIFMYGSGYYGRSEDTTTKSIHYIFMKLCTLSHGYQVLPNFKCNLANSHFHMKLS